MISTPSSARARGALAILVGLVGLAAIWIALTVADLGVRTETARQKEAELTAFRQRAVGLMGTSNRGLANPFLDGASTSLASNTLQYRVVRVIEETGGSVISVNVEPLAEQPASPQGQSRVMAGMPGQRLLLQIMAETTIDGLQKVLHRLEGEAPALIIESLLIDRRTTGVAETEDATRPTRLRIDLRVAGFARKGQP